MENESQDQGDRMKAGLAILEQLGWGTNEEVRELDEDLWRIVTECNFGTIWSRPGLSLRDRELACMSMLLALGAPGVSIHFKNAHKLGITNEELKELVLHAIPYAGLPKALGAMAILRRIQSGEQPSL
jgi:4-carboxymuconolactone decarboxylase